MSLGDIFTWSARTLADSIRRRDLSAVEIAHAYLERLAAVDPAIGAYLRPTPEQALSDARGVDASLARGDDPGPLAGVPLGLKDIFVTGGVETTCGSRILAGWRPPYDGSHASRLRSAGAVLLGKLAMDEFAMGSSNENVPGRPVENPWARGFVPGGSSGGSAAAIAARMAAISLGTDTGGSIRQPASLCGIVGLKPSYGRVSRYGMIAFASSLDQAGPMTSNVRDAASVLAVIAGHDPRDATSSDAPVPDYLAACEHGCRNMRVGIHRQALELDGLDLQVRTAFESSLHVLQDLGAELVDVDLPHFASGVAVYYVLCTAEASSNLARYDGVRYGLRASGATLSEMYQATREAGFGAEVKRRILLGTFVLRKDSYEAYYGRAQRVRTLIARDYESAFRHCDVIASPSSPVAGFRMGEKLGNPLAMYLADVFTVGANLAGLPAISIPCGFTAPAGGAPRLPIGLQLLGRPFAEDSILAAAAAYEDATPWHRERPPEVEP